MNDWLTMTACDLGRGIGAGEIDPVALTQTYLDAINGHQFANQIYARVTSERALSEATAAADRAKLGHRLSLLDGVPISWKDLFDTAGVGTEAGSKLLSGRVPDVDAVVLANATAMGMVCLGKTHMSELAFSGLGYNPSTETPPCVNDLDAVPGGSSSGAGASVAFNIAAAGIGSDTGGSVRIPAAWNDLVGLKTTAGRLSLKGVVPLSVKFDTVGPLTRSVEDAAELFAMMDSSKAPDLRGATLKGRKFAIVRTIMMDDLRDAPKAAFESAVQRMQAVGAVIEYLDVPAVQESLNLSTILMTSQAYGQWKDVIEENPDVMYPEILKRFRLGAEHSAADYVAAVNKLEEVRDTYDVATAGYDAVLAPTSAIMPPNLDRLNAEEDYYVTENLLSLRNTRVGNLLGLCGLTLPTGVPSCGIMFLCAPDTEVKLLRIGAAAEAALS